MQLLTHTHTNPPFTSPTDASIPEALNWLRPKASICGGTLVGKKGSGGRWYEQHEEHNSLEGVKACKQEAQSRSDWKQAVQKPWKRLTETVKPLQSDAWTPLSAAACQFNPAQCERNKSGKLAEWTKVRGDGERLETVRDNSGKCQVNCIYTTGLTLLLHSFYRLYH